MAKKRDIHVIPHQGGWAAKRERSEVVIHNRRGQIRDNDSYGSDRSRRETRSTRSGIS